MLAAISGPKDGANYQQLYELTSSRRACLAKLKQVLQKYRSVNEHAEYIALYRERIGLGLQDGPK